MKKLTGIAIAAAITLIATSAVASSFFYEWFLHPSHPIACWTKPYYVGPHGPVEVPFFKVSNPGATTTCTQSGPYFTGPISSGKRAAYYLQVVTDLPLNMYGNANCLEPQNAGQKCTFTVDRVCSYVYGETPGNYVAKTGNVCSQSVGQYNCEPCLNQEKISP